MRKLFALSVIVVLAALTIPALAQPVMVTICHAAGQDDTLKFGTLTIPYDAVYGQAGHLNEDGTTQAGHEEDYEGACLEDTTTTTTSSTTTTPTTTSSTTTSSTTTTVTTVQTSTTSTTDPTTTSTSTSPSTSVPSTTPSPSTTDPQTTPTLPFTGDNSGVMVGLASSLMAAGGLVLLALRRRVTG